MRRMGGEMQYEWVIPVIVVTFVAMWGAGMMLVGLIWNDTGEN